MAEDNDSGGRDEEQARRGCRRDGKPYKDGNTRDDGSFRVGDRRPPPEHRFAVDDGRERGRRPKGRKNLLTEWREELDAKIPVTENGKRKKVTKRRALIKSKIKRGIEKSDRAAETALRYAELSEKRDPGLQTDDLALIEAWLAGLERGGDSNDFDPNITDGREADQSTGDPDA